MLITRLTSGVLAGIALLASGAPAAAQTAANVTVRVEGAKGTLTPTTPVLTRAGRFTKTYDNSQTCSGTSAGGALELARNGDWGGRWDPNFGQQVERIGPETYPIDPEDFTGVYWGVYLNDKPASVGACELELQEGDEVLFFAACAGATTGCYTEPLDLAAPATVRPGEAFTVTVREVTTTFGGPPDYASSTSEGPSAGARVTGGDAAVETGADGTATVRISERGPRTLVAAKGDRVPEGRAVCVTDGADGFCGTRVPCVTLGDDGRCGTRDRRAAQASIGTVREGQRFARGRAPRELRGTVTADPSGLHAVKLRLTRRHRGRCQYFSGRLERFRDTRCGRGFAFAIGNRADWSYLLPAALPAGRYVLDAVAIDGAFNRDPLARGRNRVVFTVG